MLKAKQNEPGSLEYARGCHLRLLRKGQSRRGLMKAFSPVKRLQIKVRSYQGVMRNGILLGTIVTEGGEGFRKRRHGIHWVKSDVGERAFVT